MSHCLKHALIIGSSGIIGHQLATRLIFNGDWKVTGVQRNHCPYNPRQMNIVLCDLLDEYQLNDKLLPYLSDITHVFYVCWQSTGDEQEVHKNLSMFKNVLNLVEYHSKCLQYVYLQTGTKYYGMHLGPDKVCKTPFKEDMDRPQENMFYYPIEDYLRELHQTSRNRWNYGIARPPCIVGWSSHHAMNFAVSLGVYASILKEMGKPLIYPSSSKSYDSLREFVDTSLLSDFILWMSENPHTYGKAFNITNGDFMRMNTLWPEIARYFGMESQIADKSFNIQEFVNDKKELWNQMVDKYNLENYSLDGLGTWKFMEDMISREYDDLSSIDRARDHGYYNRKNSKASFYNLFDCLKICKIIPDVR